MAAEPSVRTRSLFAHAFVFMNCAIGGIAEVRLTTASWPSNAAVNADRSKIETESASAHCSVNAAAFSGARATAVTACPSATRARIA